MNYQDVEHYNGWQKLGGSILSQIIAQDNSCLVLYLLQTVCYLLEVSYMQLWAINLHMCSNILTQLVVSIVCACVSHCGHLTTQCHMFVAVGREKLGDQAREYWVTRLWSVRLLCHYRC